VNSSTCRSSAVSPRAASAYPPSPPGHGRAQRPPRGGRLRLTDLRLAAPVPDDGRCDPDTSCSQAPGDYVMWGAGTDHSWRPEEDSVVITVCWPSSARARSTREPEPSLPGLPRCRQASNPGRGVRPVPTFVILMRERNPPELDLVPLCQRAVAGRVDVTEVGPHVAGDGRSAKSTPAELVMPDLHNSDRMSRSGATHGRNLVT
jgi:hypothetical protein